MHNRGRPPSPSSEVSSAFCGTSTDFRPASSSSAASPGGSCRGGGRGTLRRPSSAEDWGSRTSLEGPECPIHSQEQKCTCHAAEAVVPPKVPYQAAQSSALRTLENFLEDAKQAHNENLLHFQELRRAEAKGRNSGHAAGLPKGYPLSCSEYESATHLQLVGAGPKRAPAESDLHAHHCLRPRSVVIVPPPLEEDGPSGAPAPAASASAAFGHQDTPGPGAANVPPASQHQPSRSAMRSQMQGQTHGQGQQQPWGVQQGGQADRGFQGQMNAADLIANSSSICVSGFDPPTSSAHCALRRASDVLEKAAGFEALEAHGRVLRLIEESVRSGWSKEFSPELLLAIAKPKVRKPRKVPSEAVVHEEACIQRGEPYTWVGSRPLVAMNRNSGQLLKLLTPRRARQHRQQLKLRKERLMRQQAGLKEQASHGPSAGDCSSIAAEGAPAAAKRVLITGKHDDDATLGIGNGTKPVDAWGEGGADHDTNNHRLAADDASGLGATLDLESAGGEMLGTSEAAALRGTRTLTFAAAPPTFFGPSHKVGTKPPGKPPVHDLGVDLRFVERPKSSGLFTSSMSRRKSSGPRSLSRTGSMGYCDSLAGTLTREHFAPNASFASASASAGRMAGTASAMAGERQSHRPSSAAQPLPRRR